MKRTLTQFMDNQADHAAGAVLGMKYHSIIGHGEAASDVKFVEWTQDIVEEYNNRKHTSTPKFNFYDVLVREDIIRIEDKATS